MIHARQAAAVAGLARERPAVQAMLQFLDKSRADALRANTASGSASPGTAGAPPVGAAGEGVSGQSAELPDRQARILDGLVRQAASAHPPGVLVDDLCSALAGVGAQDASGFSGIDVSEAQLVWAPLAGCSAAFVGRFLQLCEAEVARENRSRQVAMASRGPPLLSRDGRPGEQVEASVHLAAASGQPAAPPSPSGMAALALVAQARRRREYLHPGVLASAIRDMSRLPAHPFALQEHTPRTAAKRARMAAGPTVDYEVQATWLEFGGWKRSALQYASAVQLWGEAAGLAQEQPWPPSYASACAFCSLFRSSATLGKYLSHIRSVLSLVRVSPGYLADTTRLVKGAEKAMAGQTRPRVWATVAQTRELVAWAGKAGRQDIGWSWAVSRHFCFRYSETLSLGARTAPFRFVGSGAGSEAVVTFMRRKCYRAPVEVSRKCICTGRTQSLCGVCALRHAAENSPEPFSHVKYSEALAFLKAAAAAMHFENAQHWGTHAFRRGFADDALRAGGPSALFWSGGWRGLAAFGYATAQSRGALAAAEWLIEHSDSSGDESG